MQSKPEWGINWQRYHADREDMPHIERMGYKSFTIYEWMWSNRDFVNELLSVARGDAIFLARDHPLSEQKDQLWKAEPGTKGRQHADEWAQKVREGRVFTPLDRTYFLGINEPDSNHFQEVIDKYNEAYCKRLAQHGLRGAAYSFGVGHPSTVDLNPTGPVDWSWYEASATAVLEGSHLAAFHEYGAPSAGGYGWEYWCNRIAACPYPFEAIFDECGIDNGVTGGALLGWASFLKAEEYLQWLDGFQLGMAQRRKTRKVNILSYGIFGYDHGSGEDKNWFSFDIRPMRKQLEEMRWTEYVDERDDVGSPPSVIRLPVVVVPGVPDTPRVEGNMVVDPIVARAILQVESGGKGFNADGTLKIRFEAHIFKRHVATNIFDAHFRYDPNDILQAWYRLTIHDQWLPIHTGSQKDEYAALSIARTLNTDGAYESISMGAAQVMGFNAKRVGYANAKAMYDSFRSGEVYHIISFFNYCLSDPNMYKAMREKDWRQIARLYNGSGLVDLYSARLAKAYRELGGK